MLKNTFKLLKNKYNWISFFISFFIVFIVMVFQGKGFPYQSESPAGFFLILGYILLTGISMMILWALRDFFSDNFLIKFRNVFIFFIIGGILSFFVELSTRPLIRNVYKDEMTFKLRNKDIDFLVSVANTATNRKKREAANNALLSLYNDSIFTRPKYYSSNLTKQITLELLKLDNYSFELIKNSISIAIRTLKTDSAFSYSIINILLQRILENKKDKLDIIKSLVSNLKELHPAIVSFPKRNSDINRIEGSIQIKLDTNSIFLKPVIPTSIDPDNMRNYVESEFILLNICCDSYIFNFPSSFRVPRTLREKKINSFVQSHCTFPNNAGVGESFILFDNANSFPVAIFIDLKYLNVVSGNSMYIVNNKKEFIEDEYIPEGKHIIHFYDLKNRRIIYRNKTSLNHVKCRVHLFNIGNANTYYIKMITYK